MLFLLPILLAAFSNALTAAPPPAPPVVVNVEDHGYGPVDPVAVPNVEVTRHDGTRVRLPQLLRGRRSAVQFVFMDCQTACPLLGSLFQNVDRKLGSAGNVALVSISVNPDRDTPQRLDEWRKSFGASQRWTAVRADREALEAIQKAFGQQSGAPSGHSLQVFFVDREATYVARTLKLPQAARVANALLGKVEMAGRANVADTQSAEPDAPQILDNSAAPPSGQLLYRGGQPLRARVGGEPIAPAAARCINCHGEDRQGAPEGKIAPSSLAAAALVELRPRRGGPASAYTRESFCQSLQTGIDPAGVMFASSMPRYELTAGQCAVLWDFVSSR